MDKFRTIKRLFRSLAVFSALAFNACGPRSATTIEWTEGLPIRDDGTAIHRIVVRNPPSGRNWSIWFCQFKDNLVPEDGSGVEIKYRGGTLFQICPTENSGDSLVIEYRASATRRYGWAPKGFFLMNEDGGAVDLAVSYNYLPAERIRTFDYTPVATQIWDMIPSLKYVEVLEGETMAGKVSSSIVDDEQPGWYRITIRDGISIEAGDEDGLYWAGVTLDNLKRGSGSSRLPNLIIEDWPDLPYRGIMLDVSRNFTSKKNLLRLLDALAHYKVNRLHLHFGDDEGWRVEIPGLPELTAYGSKRGAPQVDENDVLIEDYWMKPEYFGGSDPNSTKLSGNGFYSQKDFVEILRYAAARHIHVIPEFDTPGHSRAAIMSMIYRKNTTEDETYLLSEEADTSRYMSVQNYGDNVMNVALESTYSFIDKVFAGLRYLYDEAGVPLDAVHVGGDEVPEGAWLGSPACRRLMESKGWSDPAMLKDYFVDRVLGIAEIYGVRIAGWQEIAGDLTPETAERLKKNLYFVNMWKTSPESGLDEAVYSFANDSIPVVLSNYTNTYLDFAYNSGKAEPGHSWGGLIDERRTFSLLPFDIYKSVRWNDNSEMVDIQTVSDGKTALLPEAASRIIGVQGQLWSETIQDFDNLTYYLFPKALGLFERGWNAHPAWEESAASEDSLFVSDFNRFYSIVVDKEAPYFESNKINYRKY